MSATPSSASESGDPFVPEHFEPPRALSGPGFRLEPLGPEHNAADHAAWMSSVDHIRATPGFPIPRGDWPTPMSLDRNRSDLEGHARDFSNRTGFTYTVLATGPASGATESPTGGDGHDVVGCVYLYPPTRPGFDVDVRSWVSADRAELDVVLWQAVSGWLAEVWPFTAPDYAPRTPQEPPTH